MIRARTLVAALALACACVAAFADQPSSSPIDSGIETVLASADTTDPEWLMLASIGLMQAGRADEATFWFYAGLLRARYSPKLQGAKAEAVTGFDDVVGEEIKSYALRDIRALMKIFDAVIAWDEKTFAAWAKAKGLDSADAALLERRRNKIEGLRSFGNDLLARRDSVEKAARANKKYEEMRKAYDEEQRRYSAQLLEFTVAGTRLRVPTNHLYPLGPVYQTNREYPDVVLDVFLPDFDGYSRDRPGQTYSSDRISIRIGSDTRRQARQQIEAFLAKGAAPVEQFGKHQVTVFEGETMPPDLPTYTTRHYFLRGRRADGNDAYYVMCGGFLPPETPSTCDVFLGETARGAPITAHFGREHLDDLELIEARLSGLLKSWMVMP